MGKAVPAATSAFAALLLGVLVAACTVGRSTCGDGQCRPAEHESCETCWVDCSRRCGCGDGRCDRAAGETCAGCPGDCGECRGVCGDAVCDAAEHCASCPADCGSCPRCGDWNCEGCCAGDVCAPGSASDACGSAGNACVVCSAGLTCAVGECTIATDSRWNVVVEAVHVDSTSFAGEAWDPPAGLPDPWVEVHVGTATGPSFSTGSGTDLVDVVYDGATASYVRADEIWIFLRFDAWDADAPDGDAWIGGCDVTGMDDAMFSGRTQTLVCPRLPLAMQSGVTFYWHLEPS